MGLPILTLLPVLVPLLASPFDLNAGVTAETRAGDSPVLAGRGPQAFIAAVVNPVAEADVHQHRLELRLAYAPRLVWQTPNPLDSTVRPLLLHQASLSFLARPTSTTDVTAHGYGSYGEPDYSVLPQLLGPGQAALPSVLKILTASGGAGVQTDVSRRWRLALGVEATHVRPIVDNAACPDVNMDGFPDPRDAMGNCPAAPPPVPGGTGAVTFLPRQTTATVTPAASFRLTRTDDLSLAGATTYATYSNGIELVFFSPMLSWRTRRAGGDELRLGLGVAFIHELGAVSALGDSPSFFPTGSVESLWKIVSQDQYGLWTRVRAIVDEFVDPVLAVATPRALVAGQLVLVVAPDWSFGVQGDFATSLRRTPLPGNPDETVLSLGVPIRHRLSENVSLELGGRWSERAPILAGPDFSLHQRQLWVYLGLTASTRDAPVWSGR